MLPFLSAVMRRASAYSMAHVDPRLVSYCQPDHQDHESLAFSLFCSPRVSACCRRIEHLISRDYLERDDVSPLRFVERHFSLFESLMLLLLLRTAAWPLLLGKVLSYVGVGAHIALLMLMQADSNLYRYLA